MNLLTPSQERLWSILKPICLLLVLLGIGFRFDSLDYKIFWQDEVLSAIRMSGRQTREVQNWGASLVNGPAISSAQLVSLQRLDPEHGIADIVRSSLSNPHTPVYYIALRLWALIFGDSVAGLRAFSALISAVTLAVVFVWCRVMFGGTREAWFAVALMALSPFQVLYAQEVRVYALMILALVSSCMFLQLAIQQDRTYLWLAYSGATLIGLCCHLLFVPVIIAQLCFVVLLGVRLDRSIAKRHALHFICALGVAVLLASPWIWTILTSNLLETHETAKLMNGSLVESWLHVFPRFISDLHVHLSALHATRWFFFAVILAAVINATRCANRSARLMLLCLLLVPTIALILPDLLRGGSRSSVIRYLTPFGVSIEISLSYLLASLTLGKGSDWKRLCGIALFAILVIAGIWSNVLNRTWALGNKTAPGTSDMPPIIAELNASQPPVILAAVDLMPLLSISQQLRKPMDIKFVSTAADALRLCLQGDQSEIVKNKDGILLTSSEILSAFERTELASVGTLVNPGAQLQLWRLRNCVELANLDVVDNVFDSVNVSK